MNAYEQKLQDFCNLITADHITYCDRMNYDWNIHAHNMTAKYKINRKYTYVDVGTSGKYIVVNETGEIYGCKAYGVIHRGHYYGTLDTINEYYWGDYTAVKKAVQPKPETPEPLDIDPLKVAAFGQINVMQARIEELEAALGDVLGAIKAARTTAAPAGHYDEDVYYNGVDFGPQLDIANEILNS